MEKVNELARNWCDESNNDECLGVTIGDLTGRPAEYLLYGRVRSNDSARYRTARKLAHCTYEVDDKTILAACHVESCDYSCELVLEEGQVVMASITGKCNLSGS